MKILGVDFTSRPGRRKPIVAAVGSLDRDGLAIDELRNLESFAQFEELLRTAGPWIGGFDFPFGLPRSFVDSELPAADWADLVRQVAALDRESFCRLTWNAFHRAKGHARLKHREVDLHAGSHSPLKTIDPLRRHAVNPPVGLMFFEGAQRLLAAGVAVPGLRESGDRRVALEAYPGWVARALGERYYKNDKPQHGKLRRNARRRLLGRLAAGEPLKLPCRVPPRLARGIGDDATGDRLDAVLCAVQAGWGARRAGARYGLPARFDVVEGWIVGVSRSGDGGSGDVRVVVAR